MPVLLRVEQYMQIIFIHSHFLSPQLMKNFLLQTIVIHNPKAVSNSILI